MGSENKKQDAVKQDAVVTDNVVDMKAEQTKEPPKEISLHPMDTQQIKIFALEEENLRLRQERLQGSKTQFLTDLNRVHKLPAGCHYSLNKDFTKLVLTEIDAKRKDTLDT